MFRYSLIAPAFVIACALAACGFQADEERRHQEQSAQRADIDAGWKLYDDSVAVCGNQLRQEIAPDLVLVVENSKVLFQSLTVNRDEPQRYITSTSTGRQVSFSATVASSPGISPARMNFNCDMNSQGQVMSLSRAGR